MRAKIREISISGSTMVKQRILILATTASMIKQFNMHNIRILQSLGAEVHVGTNFISPGTITEQSSKKLISILSRKGVMCHQIDFLRGIGTFKANKKALEQVCNIIRKEKITGIHAHSPLGGIVGRRAAHKMHVKIIYTAHGLQFFKGGPLKDWLIFYPVEWFYARWTDALITINTHDFHVSKYLPAKKKYMINGVGINKCICTDNDRKVARSKLRKKLGIHKDDYLLISIGELNKNKNHESVLKALKRLNNPKIKYVIAGIGPEKNRLLKLSNKLGLENNFQLLGYLDDLDDLYYAADLNVFVSKREGLGLGGLDGIAHGTYIIGTKNTGMSDYIINQKVGMLVNSPTDTKELAKKILIAFKEKRRVKDFSILKKFEHENVDKKMRNIYIKEFFNNC